MAAAVSAHDDPQAPSTAALSPRARAAATSTSPSLCNNLGTRSVRAVATIRPVAAIEGIVSIGPILRTPQLLFAHSVAAGLREPGNRRLASRPRHIDGTPCASFGGYGIWVMAFGPGFSTGSVPAIVR